MSPKQDPLWYDCESEPEPIQKRAHVIVKWVGAMLMITAAFSIYFCPIC